MGKCLSVWKVVRLGKIPTYLALKVGGNTENPPHPLIQLEVTWQNNNTNGFWLRHEAIQGKRWQNLITSYKVPCAICGEDHQAVLDFHHVDSSTKELVLIRLLRMVRQKTE